MTTTAEPPLLQAPEAGVIEEARARQRRQRGIVGGAIAAVALGTGILLALTGGGGHSDHASALFPAGHRPAVVARLSSGACTTGDGKALQGAPNKSLLSILGVLRRAATAADAGSGIVGGGVIEGIFVHYIRRTRVVSGSDYYIYPALLGGCGTGERPHEGLVDHVAHVNLGDGIVGGEGGGGADASEIEQGRDVETGAPGSSTSTTVTMLVPDGVAHVTLHYPAGPANGYTRKVSPPFTITAAAVDNEVVVRIPRDSGPEDIGGITMIWRAADGHIIRRFHRL